jgi:hypothetical protein
LRALQRVKMELTKRGMTRKAAKRWRGRMRRERRKWGRRKRWRRWNLTMTHRSACFQKRRLCGATWLGETLVALSQHPSGARFA